MKYFLWRSTGYYGRLSLGIMADDEKGAFNLVDKYVKDTFGKFYPAVQYKKERIGCADIITPAQEAYWSYRGEVDGWGTDEYELEIYETGQVVTIRPEFD